MPVNNTVIIWYSISPKTIIYSKFQDPARLSKNKPTQILKPKARSKIN